MSHPGLRKFRNEPEYPVPTSLGAIVASERLDKVDSGSFVKREKCGNESKCRPNPKKLSDWLVRSCRGGRLGKKLGEYGIRGFKGSRLIIVEF
jgi:hypothetical protein